MPPKHEQPKPKVLELHFKSEGYVAPGDEEFRDQFFAMLEAQGIEPANCVFRGFDGIEVDPIAGLPRDPVVYAMNLAGWNNAIQGNDDTPANYAFKDGTKKPCLAIYDKNKLTEVYSAKHLNSDEDDMAVKKIILGEIVTGDDLSTMEADMIVNEMVVHKNFPHGSPTDALVALVYLDEY